MFTLFSPPLFTCFRFFILHPFRADTCNTPPDLFIFPRHTCVRQQTGGACFPSSSLFPIFQPSSCFDRFSLPQFEAKNRRLNLKFFFENRNFPSLAFSSSLFSIEKNRETGGILTLLSASNAVNELGNETRLIEN